MVTIKKEDVSFTAALVTGFLLVLLTLIALLPHAQAETYDTECYRYTSGDSPIASPLEIQRSDVWCYRLISSPQGATLIYHVDQKGQTRPELSMLIERDGTLVHASLKKGELSVHRLRSNFNPLPVPLVPPADAERVATPIAPSSVSSADDMIKFFTDEPSRTEDIRIHSAGEFNVAVAHEMLPWRGYWFPNSSGRLHNGSDSPMAKFDRYVEARTAHNPGSQSWEGRNHFYDGHTNWAGHCNGWAAASVLRKEPSGPWTDPVSGITFGVNDQKGLLIERDYCPNMLFFGHRNSGDGPGLGDINAVDFHNTLSYYLGVLGKPVLMDMMPTAPVENRVISGYKMKITEAGTNVYDVNAVLTVHSYDSAPSDDPGVAPSEERTYRYRLWTDPSGHVIKGQWYSTNPDFLWVPLSPAQCDYQNPGINEFWAETIAKPLEFPGWN